MPRRVATEDDWDDDRDNEEFDPPDEEWQPDEDAFHEDDDDTDPCPHCGEPIYHGAERCPHCEKYISEEDAPTPQKPTWIAFTAVVCLIVVVVYWVFGGG